jgi:hypothetical protein
MAGDAEEQIGARTLLIPGMYGGDTFGGPAEGTIDAYRINSQGLSPVTLVRNSRFGNFATDWEKEWSGLLVTRNQSRWKVSPVTPLPPLAPVVDASGLVVGHFGWVNASSVLIPEKSKGTGIRDLLLDGTTVLIRGGATGSSKPETIDSVNYIRPYTTEERFQFVTDVEGRALAQTSYDIVGVESADATFWTLISIGSLVIGLGRLAGRRIVASLITRATARTAATRVGRMSVEEMERYLIGVMQRRPELGKLYAIRIRNLSGEALQKEVLAVLRTWEQGYSRSVQIVEQGVVQKMTRPGNLMSLQGDKLMIERQVLADSKTFFDEVVHELSADALAVRGQGIGASQLAFIGEEFTVMNNAFFILENSIKTVGGLKVVLNGFRGL